LKLGLILLGSSSEVTGARTDGWRRWYPSNWRIGIYRSRWYTGIEFRPVHQHTHSRVEIRRTQIPRPASPKSGSTSSRPKCFTSMIMTIGREKAYLGSFDQMPIRFNKDTSPYLLCSQPLISVWVHRSSAFSSASAIPNEIMTYVHRPSHPSQTPLFPLSPLYQYVLS
jgi:hypothetical protein